MMSSFPPGDGQHATPNSDSVPLSDDERALLLSGIRLNNRGEFFAAHEVIEEAWVRCASTNRRFLQAIIHIAVANHHAANGNPVGAERQLRKAVKKLTGYPAFHEQINTRDLANAALEVISSLQSSSTAPGDHFVAIPIIFGHETPP